MSTKCTLVYSDKDGNKFHLYHDGFDFENVHLRLSGVEFEATAEGVTVAIPMATWETIRRFAGMSFDWADWTDEQVAAYAREQIDDRLAKIREYEEAHPGKKDVWWRIRGFLTLGSADEPYDEQVRHATREYTCARDWQRKMRDLVAEMVAEGMGDSDLPLARKEPTDANP